MKHPHRFGSLYLLIPAIVAAIAVALAATSSGNRRARTSHKPAQKTDSVAAALTLPHFKISEGGDTVWLKVAPEDRRGTLTDEDFREVAEELGVEVAAVKAVVDIEAGRTHQGFWSEDHPIINFDLSVYSKMAPKQGVNIAKARASHPVIFSRPNTRRYGSQQAAQQARLDAAMSIDSISAIYGTFWGMFQIGGFNWKKCGTSSPLEFYHLMCRSERDQLDLFANFVRDTGLLKHLKAKNWSAFAKGYNGPGFASRGYHTRLAAAYRKHK